MTVSMFIVMLASMKVLMSLPWNESSQQNFAKISQSPIHNFEIFVNVRCELYLEADDELDNVEACFEGVAEEADEHDGEQHGRGRHVALLKWRRCIDSTHFNHYWYGGGTV